MAAFRKGQKVKSLNDRSPEPRVGIVLGPARTRQIRGLEGVLETKEIYVVRFMVPVGDRMSPSDQEIPGEVLVLVD